VGLMFISNRSSSDLRELCVQKTVTTSDFYQVMFTYRYFTDISRKNLTQCKIVVARQIPMLMGVSRRSRVLWTKAWQGFDVSMFCVGRLDDGLKSVDFRGVRLVNGINKFKNSSVLVSAG